MLNEEFKSKLSQLFAGDMDSLAVVKTTIEKFTKDEIPEFVAWLDQEYLGDDNKLQTCSADVLIALSQWLCGTHPNPTTAQTSWQIAIYFLQFASETLENATAQYFYADLYSKGVSGILEQDTEHALSLLKASAHGEYPPAQHDLAQAYEKGMSDHLEQNMETALVLYEQAAETYGPAQMRMAMLSQQKDDFKQSWQWLNKAAANNVADAYYSLAMMFAKGVNTSGVIIPKDSKKSLQYLTEAAKLGNKDAQFDVALNLLKAGGPIKRNPLLAYQFMHSAAQNGHAVAKQQLVKHDVFELGGVVLQQQVQLQLLTQQLSQLQQTVVAMQQQVVTPTTTQDSITAVTAGTTASSDAATAVGVFAIPNAASAQTEIELSNTNVEFNTDSEDEYHDASSELVIQSTLTG